MIDKYNIEAEKDFISVILNYPEIIIHNVEKIRTELFFDPFHQKIISKIKSNILEDSPIEISTISNNPEEQEVLRSVKVRGQTEDRFDIFYKELEECLVARELISMSKTLITTLDSDKQDAVPSELLHSIKNKVEDLEQIRTTSHYSASDVVDTVVDRYMSLYEAAADGRELVQEKVLQTQYQGLNNLLKRGGLSGEYFILAAPTSTGKTEFALNVASHAAIDLRKRVFIYSLEMEKEKLVERLLLERSKVDSFKLERGKINDVDITRLRNSASLIRTSDIIFDDNMSGDIFDIVTSIRKAHHKKPLDLVVIDYLQLITNPINRGNRTNEVTNISRILKQESSRLGVTFIVLSQLSRLHLMEGREPELHDLRESGAIEQDADCVLFLYSTSQERKNKIQSKTKSLLKKQRDGSVGEFFLMNHKTIQTFEEIKEVEYNRGKISSSKKKQEVEEEEDLNLPF